MKPTEYDDILRMIEDIPKEWNKGDKDKINFKIIAHREDANWVLSRIFEEVDRNLISANIQARSSKYSLEIDIGLAIIGAPVTAVAVNILLEELRDYLKKKLKTRK